MIHCRWFFLYRQVKILVLMDQHSLPEIKVSR